MNPEADKENNEYRYVCNVCDEKSIPIQLGALMKDLPDE